MLRTSAKRNPFNFLAFDLIDLVLLQEIASAISDPDVNVSVSAHYNDEDLSTFPPLALPLVFRHEGLMPDLHEFRITWRDALGVLQTRFVEPYYSGCPVGCDCGDDSGPTFCGWSVAV